MSGSLASAKAKRAGIAPSLPPPPPQTAPIQNRLTIQQVIHVIDTRLTKLEADMKAKPVTASVPVASVPA